MSEESSGLYLQYHQGQLGALKSPGSKSLLFMFNHNILNLFSQLIIVSTAKSHHPNI